MVMWFLHCPGTTTVSNSSQIQVVSWFARRNQWTIPNSWPQQGDFGSWFQMVLPCFTWNTVKSVVNVRWFLWMTMQRNCEKGWFRELILTFDGVQRLLKLPSTFSFARSSTYGSGRDSGISCHHSSIGKLNSCQLFSTSGFAFGLFVELDIGPSTTCYALSARSNASNQWPPQHLSWWWCSLEVQHKFLEYVQAQVAEQTSVSFSNISRITADHGTSKLDRMHENATS